MLFPFCRIPRLSRRPTAKTIQNTSHTATWHRPFDQRNWCCVHCTCMLCIPKSAGHRPQTLPPSQRSKAIKVYSTFFRDDFVWTLSRCSGFFFGVAVVVFVFCLCEYFRFCVIRKLPLRSIRMRFFPPIALSLGFSRFGNCKNVLKI